MDSDGNAVVLVDSDRWLMSPDALENLSAAEATLPSSSGNGSTPDHAT